MLAVVRLSPPGEDVLSVDGDRRDTRRCRQFHAVAIASSTAVAELQARICRALAHIVVKPDIVDRKRAALRRGWARDLQCQRLPGAREVFKGPIPGTKILRHHRRHAGKYNLPGRAYTEYPHFAPWLVLGGCQRQRVVVRKSRTPAEFVSAGIEAHQYFGSPIGLDPIGEHGLTR